MRVNRKTAYIRAAAAAAQSLPEPAIRVFRVDTLDPAAANPNDLTNWPVVTGAPGASQVQFTGTPTSPSSTLTFGTALAADQQVLVEYAVEGSIPVER